MSTSGRLDCLEREIRYLKGRLDSMEMAWMREHCIHSNVVKFGLEFQCEKCNHILTDSEKENFFK